MGKIIKKIYGKGSAEYPAAAKDARGHLVHSIGTTCIYCLIKKHFRIFIKTI